MDTRKIGAFEYIDPLSADKLNKLPEFLRLPTATTETVLLRLLLGHLHFRSDNGRNFNSRKNFFYLPHKQAPTLTYNSIRDSINELLRDDGNEFSLDDDKCRLQSYLNMNRKNTNVYQLVLFELSLFLSCQSKSSIAAFAHLYRCLEYLSYSFPLVYAAKSKDYKGSFNDLKRFLSGDSAGELKFFRKFLEALFNDEAITLEYVFEMDIAISYPLPLLKADMTKIYRDFPYDFDDNVLKIRFKDMLSFFIATRNRYFHMLIGQGQDNFTSIDYDIDEYFGCINLYLLNWLAIVVQKITAFGFYSSLPGL